MLITMTPPSMVEPAWNLFIRKPLCSKCSNKLPESMRRCQIGLQLYAIWSRMTIYSDLSMNIESELLINERYY